MTYTIRNKNNKFDRELHVLFIVKFVIFVSTYIISYIISWIWICMSVKVTHHILIYHTKFFLNFFDDFLRDTKNKGIKGWIEFSHYYNFPCYKTNNQMSGSTCAPSFTSFGMWTKVWLRLNFVYISNLA